MTVDQLKLNMIVYHEKVYNGREELKIVGIRECEVEVEGDFSGGTHQIHQKTWLPIKGLSLHRNQSVSEDKSVEWFQDAIQRFKTRSSTRFVWRVPDIHKDNLIFETSYCSKKIHATWEMFKEYFNDKVYHLRRREIIECLHSLAFYAVIEIVLRENPAEVDPHKLSTKFLKSQRAWLNFIDEKTKTMETLFLNHSMRTGYWCPRFELEIK